MDGRGRITRGDRFQALLRASQAQGAEASRRFDELLEATNALAAQTRGDDLDPATAIYEVTATTI